MRILQGGLIGLCLPLLLAAAYADTAPDATVRLTPAGDAGLDAPRPAQPAPAPQAPVLAPAQPLSFGPQKIAYPGGVTATFDITYGNLKGFRPLTLDIYQPSVRANAMPLVVFVHGGGWQQGSIDASDWQARGLAAASGLPVLSISYRLAPEHPFPAPLQDVVRAIEWAMAGGIFEGKPCNRLMLSGASAGANLALGAWLKLRDEGRPLPVAMGLFYGVYGDDLDTPSYREFGDGRFGLPRDAMATYFADYLPDPELRNSPYAVPMKADLKGLPPIWLGIAELDVLRDDSRLLAERLRSSGISPQVVEYDGMVRGFCARARMVPAARSALADCGKFLRTIIET